MHLSKDAPSLAFWADVHVRRAGDNAVVLARPALGFQATPWLSVWAGYAWTPVFLDEPDAGVDQLVHEHRSWQQGLLQYETSFRLNLQSRTRLEQRFNESGPTIGHRLRQFMRVSWRPSADVPVGVLVSDELFVGLGATEWGQPGGIDQNRLFAGPFFQLTTWARVEAGYLFVYLDRPNDRYVHAFSVSLFITPRL